MMPDSSPTLRQTGDLLTADSSAKDPRTIWLLAVCRFGEAVAVGMLIPSLPLFIGTLGTPWIDGFGADLARIFPWLTSSYPAILKPSQELLTAILFSITGLAMAGSQIISGRLSDRFDTRKNLIVAGMFLGAICSFALQFAEHYSHLVLLRILQGSFLGLTFPPMMAIIARNTPKHSGGKVLGTYSTIRLLGFGLGPVLGGVVGDRGGYDLVFLVSGSLLLLSVLLVTVRIRDSKEFPGERQERGPLPPVEPIFRLLAMSIFIMMVGISAVISLFPFYEREFDATQSQLGMMFAIFVGSRCLFQYPSGWAGDRLDKKWLLIGGLILFVPLVALQARVEDLQQLTWIRAGLGVVSAAISTSVGGISSERSMAGNRARTMGLNTMSFSLGTAVGPSLTGFIETQSVAFAIPATAGVLLIVSLGILLPSDRNFRRSATPGDDSSVTVSPLEEPE